MVTDNNGNYTPPIHGDPRGSLGTGGMGWSEPKSVVMSMPPTRPEAITSQVELQGDIKAAGTYVPLVRQQMQAMHQQNISNLEIMDRPVNLGDGKMMVCQRRFNADKAIINIPSSNKRALGPLHLNFDPSVMTEFGQTILDKNYGLPLGLTNFTGSLSSSGLTLSGKLLNNATADGSTDGTIYYCGESNNNNGRTFFIPISFSLPFEESGGQTRAGYGVDGFFTTIMSPLNYIAQGFTASASGTTWNGQSLYSALYMYGDISYEKRHNLSNSFSHVVAIRSKATDIISPDGISYKSPRLTDVFLDGDKIGESAGPSMTWGSYYPGNRSMYFFYANSSGSASMIIRQKMLYAAHLDDSQIREVTDNLAAKWGF